MFKYWIDYIGYDFTVYVALGLITFSIATRDILLY